MSATTHEEYERRLEALRLANVSFPGQTPEEIVKRADIYRAFLAGEADAAKTPQA